MQPSYRDSELIQALNFAVAVGLLALIELAALSNNLQLAQATMAGAEQFAAT